MIRVTSPAIARVAFGLATLLVLSSDVCSTTATAAATLKFVNSATPTMPGLQPGAVATGDFNNDGNLDLAIADATNNLVAVFLGKGDGTFKAGVSYPVGQKPVGIAVADLNNDSKLDLVTANQNDNTLSVLLGNGDGSFQGEQAVSVSLPTDTISPQPSAIAVGDMDGDGKPDLIVTLLTCMSCPNPGKIPSGLAIFLGNGDGTFRAETNRVTLEGEFGASSPNGVITGDFNSDGKLDVAISEWGDRAQFTITVLLGDGQGSFSSGSSPGLYEINQPASSIVAGDFNRDGKLDLAVTNDSSGFTGPGQSSYSILLGNGDGTFQNPVTTELAVNSTPISVQTADFNGDGIADLAMIGSGNPMILLGNGDGTFQTPQSFPFGESALVVGDFNGDGLPDLAGPAVLLNATPGVVAPSFTVGASPSSLTLASGKQGTVMVTVTPQAGFSHTVSFACSGLPAGASCTFNPTTLISSGAAASTTLTVTAPTPTAMLPGHSDPLFPKLIPALVLGLLWPRRWWRRVMVLLAISLAGLTFLSACGGSSSPHPGSSTVTVTATSGSIKKSLTIALTVN